MVPIESGILSKTILFIIAKIMLTVSFRWFTKTLNQFFYLTEAGKNLKIDIPVLFYFEFPHTRNFNLHLK